MIGRNLFAPLLALALVSLLATACGGGDGTARPAGHLTDPRSVPTATPWAEAPQPIILEPGALTPISEDSSGEGGEDSEGNGGGEATPGECGETYTVQANDSPYGIAQKCGVDVGDLMELNDIDDPTTLRVGQELKIPQ
jgi:LysM repeat protein